MQPERETAGADERARVLATAVINASGRLGLSQARLARVIGMSAASVSRMAAGRLGLSPESKEGELGLLFVRLFRSLDSIVGTDLAARTWLGSQNLALNATPASLIESTAGLVHVLDYLDAARARV